MLKKTYITVARVDSYYLEPRQLQVAEEFSLDWDNVGHAKLETHSPRPLETVRCADDGLVR